MAATGAVASGVATLEDLLDDLDNAARTPARQRSINVSGIVEKLSNIVYQTGLSNHFLSRLIDVITLPNELDQASLAALIRNMYPAEKVLDAIVVNVIASLGHGRSKPSLSIQNALLKWLISIYDVLLNQKILSELYAVLFNLLDTLALRAALCQLLSLITRRKHVRPFRIQSLMELTRQFGGTEAPVLGLLRVYKDYYPDVIVGDAVAGRASVFTHPNIEWKQHLLEIQSTQAIIAENGERSSFKVSRPNRGMRQPTGSFVIPEVHTSNASATSTTLDEIEGVSDFIENLEKIEPPNQIVAVIADPLLQKFLQLRQIDTNAKRVDSWLFAFFEDQLQNPDKGDVRVLEMLQAILDYAKSTRILPHACLSYLRSMLPGWNGTVGRDTILQLLTYVQPGDFQELLRDTFELLQGAILEDDSEESQVRMLLFYTDLLDNWTSLVTSQPLYESYTSSITSLIQYATILSLNILQTSQRQSSFHAILNFYESVVVTISHPELQFKVRITTPPAELVYALHFSSSISTVSRLCAILASYKRAFEAVMAPKAPGKQNKDIQVYNKDYVNHFNGFLMDVCNCLWRARALNNSDPNALGCLVDRQVVGALTTYVSSLDTSLTLPSLFSFSTSPIMCLIAINYIRQLEDENEDSIHKRHAGPVSQASLKQLEIDGGLKLSWQDYKLGVLQHLESNGIEGIGELMYNTMKHLMSTRTKKI